MVHIGSIRKMFSRLPNSLAFLLTKRYKKWDLYAAVNMVYSDFYDEDKPDSMYIKDGSDLFLTQISSGLAR
jgi:hypothetical protein